MMKYDELKIHLLERPKKWLITGVAGFIGSNLLEQLLKLNQTVVGLDNFSTGYQKNIDKALAPLKDEQVKNFKFIKGDIRDINNCLRCCEGIDIVLHQAALGSVPRSINDPITTNQNNIDGFLNMLVASRDNGIKRFVYAASSSTYGDHPGLPKVEDRIGKPLSPYAVTKYVNELYADVFGRVYGMQCIGLRYFNVFGPRQDPDGAYAAVIPKWFAGLLKGGPVYINGDGETSRDFCFIENVLQANLLAACTEKKSGIGQVYNIAFGERTTLNQLFGLILEEIAKVYPDKASAKPTYRDFRPGDVKHSLADISKASKLIGYSPTHSVRQGLQISAQWYIKKFL